MWRRTEASSQEPVKLPGSWEDLQPQISLQMTVAPTDFRLQPHERFKAKDTQDTSKFLTFRNCER